MKIAVITTSFLPKFGGAEFVVHHLANHWVLLGHEVHVLNYTTDKTSHKDAAYSIHKYKVPRGSTRFGYHNFPFNSFVTRKIERELKKIQPDFISAHVAYPTAIWLSSMDPIPRFIITSHGSDLTHLQWGDRNKYKIDDLLLKSLNKSAGVIAISAYTRKILEKIGVNPGRIIDIPNGVDTNHFKKKIALDIYEKFDIPKESLIILTIANEHPAKALDIGIQSFAKLNNLLPNIYYLIIGRGVSKWQALAKVLGVQSKIIFCDGLFDDDLIAAYQQSDILFSPSNWEMCSLVILEGMAAGLPLVITNVGGSQELIQGGQNGFIVEPQKPDQMAEALKQLAVDESLRNRMSDANIVKAKFYDWTKISQLYLKYA